MYLGKLTITASLFVVGAFANEPVRYAETLACYYKALRIVRAALCDERPDVGHHSFLQIKFV